jgi:steroid delta-isomerase-like uncharacterized protein
MPMTRLLDGWNAREGRAVAAAYAPDGVRIEVAKPGARLEGREAIASHTQGYFHALPDFVLEDRGVYRNGDTVTFEWTVLGTHTGDIPGFPASGRKIRLMGASVCRMDGEQIAEERVYWDSATLYGLMD